MITRDPELLSALSSVISTHLKLETDKSAEAHRQFYAALTYATREFEGKHDTTLASYVCQYWLRYFSTTLVNSSYHEGYCYDMDSFIELALNHGLTQSLVEEEKPARVLAVVVGARVIVHADGTPHQEHNNVKKVLKAWFEQPVPDDAVNTLAGCIDYLYGPGVWALYAADVEWQDDIIGYLYKQGLQPVGPKPSNMCKTEGPDSNSLMPNDVLNDFR